MAQPAPRMMIAPEKNSKEVPRTVEGEAMVAAPGTKGAARRVEKRQGKKR